MATTPNVVIKFSKDERALLLEALSVKEKSLRRAANTNYGMVAKAFDDQADDVAALGRKVMSLELEV